LRRGHTPLRTCVGCRGRYPKGQLVRFVSGDRGIELGSARGRGLYLCSNLDCFSRALERKGPKRLSGKGLDAVTLAPLREAVTQAKHAACGASGGGAIG
jgi:predicted RNA-binding protein YlxR (DUF448 family)